MTKKELRHHYLQQRKELSRKQHQQLSRQITERVFQLILPSYQWIHVFLPLARQAEVALEPLITSLWECNKKIVVPKLMSQGEMTHNLWTQTTHWQKNNWGIIEPLASQEIRPDQIDPLIVPLLAVDQNGQRVGYGKGYYDRFLSQCSDQVHAMGVGFFPVVEVISDCEVTDIPLDSYITPIHAYFFKG